jgi:DNA primase catalytic core
MLSSNSPERKWAPRVERFHISANGFSLGEYLDQQVIPRLRPEVIYTDPAHNWQKSSDRWRGGCPWHCSQSGTSFVVTLSNLRWYCPGCGNGGGPLQYLHRLRGGKGSPRGEEFINLLREVCQLAQVPFPERSANPEQQERYRRLLARQEVLESTYVICRQRLLADTEESDKARAYLCERGFQSDHQEQLELGLYPPTVDLHAALAGCGYDLQDLTEACVLMEKMAGYITFPWRDERGRPLTLYGTWVGRQPPEGTDKKMALRNPKEQGKAWLATKRSPYLLDRALQAQHRSLVLVEGVTDAALCQVMGDTRVVACVGGTLSREQVETLRRCGVESVTIALDPDKAGENNTAGAIRSLAWAGITPYVAPKLPDGQDPDDFIKEKGLAAWRSHIEQRRHGYRHLAGELIGRQVAERGELRPEDDAWGDDLVCKAMAEAKRLPQGRPDELERHFLRPIAEKVGSDSRDLVARLAREVGPAEPVADDPGRPDEPAPGGDSESREAWLNTAELVARDCKPAWLVQKVLVAGQPAVIGAPKKTLKTSLMVDLAVSLGSGTPFLSHFRVPGKVRVAMLSGESGEFTLKDTVQRVCRERSVSAAEVDCLWGFKLPRLGVAEDLAWLRDTLDQTKCEVLILDPLYLSLLAGTQERNAANLYDMGPLLQGACRACLDVGCTPLLVHHANRQLRTGEVMDLEHLSYSGVAEFVRQWVLLSRREGFEPGSGKHQLWMSVGGSVGHSGCYALDIDEGQLLDNFTGRSWLVTVSAGHDAIRAQQNARQAAKEEKRQEQQRKDADHLLSVLDGLDPTRQGVSTQRLREGADLGSRGCGRLGAAVRLLVQQGVIEEVDVQVPTGRKGKGTRGAAGIRRLLRVCVEGESLPA